MSAISDAIRPDVKTSVAPVSVYPYQRFGTPPRNHVQLFDSNDTRGRPVLSSERSALAYIHLYNEDENGVDGMYESLQWINGYCVLSFGGLLRLAYHLNSAAKTQDPDETMHVTSIWNVDYHRLGGEGV